MLGGSFTVGDSRDPELREDELIYDLMKSRRSIRRFRPEAPPAEAIERLIEAAVTAPSASNKQPWRFLIVTRRETIAAMADAVREAVERMAVAVEPSSEGAFRAYGDYFTRFEGAPVVIVTLYRSLTLLSHLTGDRLGVAEADRLRAIEDRSGLIGAAMAMQNLLLMAHESGLGASGMTGPLVASDRLRAVLDVPPSWNLAALIPVGYAAETPPPTDRKPVERVMTWIR